MKSNLFLKTSLMGLCLSLSGTVLAMDNHQHHGDQAQKQHATKHKMNLTIGSKVAVATTDSYLALQEALASDDLEGAKSSLKKMMKVSGHGGELGSLIHKMLAAKSLEEMRVPYFETLSNAYLHAIRMSPAQFQPGLVQMYCPMANKNQGASWIQSSNKVKNPYFGKSMLGCGSKKAQLTQ